MRLRDLVLRAGARNLWVIREDLARRYISGEGIEIGAMTMPQRLPPSARVRYVDRMSRVDLIRVDGPALSSAGNDPHALVNVDVIDDAATLGQFKDSSLDFVIAHHVLEHLEDPISGLQAMVRVLKPRCAVMLTLPDARYGFDRGRPRTPVAHLLLDHDHGPETSRSVHYREWAELIEGAAPQDVPARMAQFAAQDARHHFHVWELADFLELLRALDLPAEVIHAQSYHKEFAVVLRKSA